MDPQAAASSMILLVVLMLSAEPGSGAVTSTEDPEPPSGNVSQALRVGAGGVRPGNSSWSGCAALGKAAPGSAGRRAPRRLHAAFTPSPAHHYRPVVCFTVSFQGSVWRCADSSLLTEFLFGVLPKSFV